MWNKNGKTELVEEKMNEKGKTNQKKCVDKYEEEDNKEDDKTTKSTEWERGRGRHTQLGTNGFSITVTILRKMVWP